MNWVNSAVALCCYSTANAPAKAFAETAKASLLPAAAFYCYSTAIAPATAFAETAKASLLPAVAFCCYSTANAPATAFAETAKASLLPAVALCCYCTAIALAMACAETAKASPHPANLVLQANYARDTPRFERTKLAVELPDFKLGEGYSGDFDGDGTDDYLAFGEEIEQAWLLSGSANGSYRASVLPVPTTVNPNGGAVGDFDADGVDEVLLPELTPESTWAAAQLSGEEIRITPVALPFRRTELYYHAVAEFGSGDPPLLLALPRKSQELQLLRYAGPARFELVGAHAIEHGMHALSPRTSRGTETDVLLLRSAEGKKAADMITVYNDLTTSKEKIWTRFELYHKARYGEHGDFNGDGHGDYLVRGDLLLGWWLLAGGERGAVPISIDSLFQETELTYDVVVGDFNGDGNDDLFARPWVQKSPTPPTIWFSLPGRPLAGVEVAHNGSVLGYTGADGILLLPEQAAKFEPKELSFHSQRALVLRGRTQLARPLRRVQLLGYEKLAAPDTGRAIDAGGKLAQRLSPPYVCTSFVPQHSSDFGLQRECPDGYALFSTIFAGIRSDDGDYVGHAGICCPLPASDILQGEVFFAKQQCGKDSLAVGWSTDWREESVACRRIDRRRYALAEPAPGVYWSYGLSSRGGQLPLRVDQIPLALRIGVTRQNTMLQSDDGCLGRPFGSVLVNRGGRGCGSYLFSRLLTATGEAVEMFPDCSFIENERDARAGCRLRAVQTEARN